MPRNAEIQTGIQDSTSVLKNKIVYTLLNINYSISVDNGTCKAFFFHF